MQHREQTPEQERLTTLALAVQEHCFDYFDGKLSGQEWLQLVVDAVQSHQAEAAPKPYPTSHRLMSDHTIVQREGYANIADCACGQVFMLSGMITQEPSWRATTKEFAEPRAVKLPQPEDQDAHNYKDGWEIDQEEVQA